MKPRYIQITTDEDAAVAVIKINKGTTQKQFEKKLLKAVAEDTVDEVVSIDYPKVEDTVKWSDGDYLRFKFRNADDGEVYEDKLIIQTTWVY